MKRTYISRNNNRAIPEAIGHMGNLNPDKEWEIIIKPYKKNKSTQQRNYYHKLLDILSEYNGDTVEDLKTRICFYLGYTRQAQLKDRMIEERLSTEKMGVEQYSKMIEETQKTLMILELKFPSPDEDKGYSR